jgi:hypothetical protein
MKRTTTVLLGTLALLAAFEAGMQFDRWLHRPIAGLEIRSTVSDLPNASPQVAPGDPQIEAKIHKLKRRLVCAQLFPFQHFSCLLDT